MALFSRDKDNKKAAKEAIREGRQESRGRGREARDESLAAGDTRKQARAKKRLAKRETPIDEEELEKQVATGRRSSGNVFPSVEQRRSVSSTPPESRRGEPQREEPRRTKPSPEELGVTQKEADDWRVNTYFTEDESRYPERYLTGPGSRELTNMTPEQIAEMEAEVARTDRPPPSPPSWRPSGLKKRPTY